MKLIIALALLLVATNAKPLFTMPTVELKVTPAQVQEWIIAFMKGMKIDDITTASGECKTEIDRVFTQTAVALNAFSNGEIYIGLLNLTTAFGYFSPLTRTCATTIDEISAALADYQKQFANFDDFVSKVSLNVMGNIQPLRNLGMQIIGEYVGNKNMTKIFNLSGQMVYVCLDISPEVLAQPAPLTYTETNPYAANPLKNWIWNPMECAYHFLTNSKMTTAESLGMCEGATANLLLDTQAGFRYENQGDWRNAIFAWADAFSYTHDMVQGCTETGQQIGSVSAKIWNQRITNFKMFTNIWNNFFGVLNASTFLAAEIIYSDTINTFGAAGSLAYPLMVKGLN